MCVDALEPRPTFTQQIVITFLQFARREKFIPTFFAFLRDDA
jgi:hypothetical protein